MRCHGEREYLDPFSEKKKSTESCFARFADALALNATFLRARAKEKKLSSQKIPIIGCGSKNKMEAQICQSIIIQESHIDSITSNF